MGSGRAQQGPRVYWGHPRQGARHPGDRRGLATRMRPRASAQSLSRRARP